jgi:hypothetical protein
MDRRRAPYYVGASLLASAMGLTSALAGSPAVPETIHASAPSPLDYVVLASLADGVGVLSMVGNRMTVSAPIPSPPPAPSHR